MAKALTRIFSDLHFRDPASSLSALSELAPLFDGATRIVLNGDTLDTRPNPYPAATEALRLEVNDFFAHHAPPVTILTGNHDPDISRHHFLELADRLVFVTHGDILFDDIVPWSRDALRSRQRISAELAALPPERRALLSERLAAFRRAAATIPQRHQSERNRLKYAVGFAADTIWPPTRIFRVMKAWRDAPRNAATLLREHQLPAAFFVMGHTHRLGTVKTKDNRIVFNTGSFCPPCDGGVVDVVENRILLRRVERRGLEYRLGAVMAEFPLAAIPRPATVRP